MTIVLHHLIHSKLRVLLQDIGFSFGETHPAGCCSPSIVRQRMNTRDGTVGTTAHLASVQHGGFMATQSVQSVQPLLRTTRARGIPPTALKERGRVGLGERLITGALGGGLALLGFRRGGWLGLTAILAGGALFARGATGYCPLYAAAGVNPIEDAIAKQYGWSTAAAISRTITISRPRNEVYSFWRKAENLPRFMAHVENVSETGNGRMHWVMRTPLAGKMEWDARIIEDRPNERLSWKSEDNAPMRSTATVEFRDAPHGRGTEVTLMMAHEPWGGHIGRAVLMLFQKLPARQAHADLRSLKQLLETGELATSAVRREDAPAARLH
jgi:uncharacterized membrane protein